MAKEGEEKTIFITPFGTFCFVQMPEGLKNGGPTFTRMMGEVIKPQIGRNTSIRVTPRFLISIISANDLINQVKHVDFGQTLVNLGHHLENLANNH
jgi:hypothetical protein